MTMDCEPNQTSVITISHGGTMGWWAMGTDASHRERDETEKRRAENEKMREIR
jgi:hypothetical protein